MSQDDKERIEARMQYYHVYIDRDGDETEETDFTKEKLIEHIVKPYKSRKKFLCRGTIVDPSEITTIRIIETMQPASELLPKIKAEKGILGLLASYSSDVMLLAEKGRDITREFIWPKSKQQKQRPPTTQAKNKSETLLELKNIQDKFDFTRVYDKVKISLPQSLRDDIGNAIELFKRENYDSAIVKSYKVSEIILRNIFTSIYASPDAEKVRKHEDKLKRIWNDEQLEKTKYPGIQLVASLFSVILWYRNKMGAHAELPPSMEAARISLIALLQSIAELRRLGFFPPIEFRK